jgi:hypothetical protein
MEYEAVVHLKIQDDDMKFFDIDEIDEICRTVNEVIRHGLYPDSAAPGLTVEIRPLSEIISC